MAVLPSAQPDRLITTNRRGLLILQLDDGLSCIVLLSGPADLGFNFDDPQPYSKRFEDAVGEACEGAAARQVARRMRLAESTVRAIDLRYLERWEARRRKPPLRHMGVDEIYKGKREKFLTVVSNLETAEPLWFGRERKRETLDEFFRSQLRRRQRKRIEAACLDMWEPFRMSIQQWAPQCQIV